MRVRDRVAPLLDAALPSSGLLLDPDALGAWLTARTGEDWSVTALRRRHTPATRLVLSFRATVTTAGSRRVLDGVARTCSSAAAAELDRAAGTTTSPTLVARDRRRRMLVTTAAGDRALPLLAFLDRRDGPDLIVERLLPDRPDLAGGRVRTLRHDPGHRWVGVLDPPAGDPVLLRAYRAGRVRGPARRYESLADTGPRTPRLLAVSDDLGAAAVEWMPGPDLGSVADLAAWSAAGETLARLHRCADVALPRSAPGSESAAVLRAARRVSAVSPGLRPEVTRLAGYVARLLERLPRDDVVMHGTFSADQVVLSPAGGVALVDLDAVRCGPSAADVGCAVAIARARSEAVGMPARGLREAQALLAGYSEVRRPPDPFALAVHELACRLRSADDPFRTCRPDWLGEVTERVVATRSVLDQLGNGYLDDLAGPV